MQRYKRFIFKNRKRKTKFKYWNFNNILYNYKIL